MSLKNYLKLLFHVVVTMLIILSAPVTLAILLNDRVADWIAIVSALASGLVTIFFGINYVIFLVYKTDLFKDMF